jgi:hypothetical protein
MLHYVEIDPKEFALDELNRLHAQDQAVEKYIEENFKQPSVMFEFRDSGFLGVLEYLHDLLSDALSTIKTMRLRIEVEERINRRTAEQLHIARKALEEIRKQRTSFDSWVLSCKALGKLAELEA